MYCDRCGTPFNSGSQYCTSCGKQLMAAAPAAASTTATAAKSGGDGRVRRNINIVAGFWLANGILRLLGLGWWMIFRRLFFDGGWGWPLANWDPGFHNWMWGGLFAGGVFLGFCESSTCCWLGDCMSGSRGRGYWGLSWRAWPC